MNDSQTLAIYYGETFLVFVFLVLFVLLLSVVWT